MIWDFGFWGVIFISTLCPLHKSSLKLYLKVALLVNVIGSIHMEAFCESALVPEELKSVLFSGLGEAAEVEDEGLQSAAGRRDPEDVGRPGSEGGSAKGSQAPPTET